MKLLAESGSTKTEWSLVEGPYVIEHAFTDGINPYFQMRREVSRSIRLQLPEVFFKKKIDKIYFYGAGCASEEKKAVLKASLTTQFRTPVEVESDLLGAVRALFGREPGIGCILGTGSNSCFYDGTNIVSNVAPLGYILGDEGSGAVLGKLFLSDCLKGLAPKDLSDQFYEKYRVSAAEIMEYVYRRPFPNRFLAAFSYFLAENITNPYVYDMVAQNFRNFFVRNVLQYDYKNYTVNFMGSVAASYEDVIRSVASEFGVEVGQVKQSPMPGLIKFHNEHVMGY